MNRGPLSRIAREWPTFALALALILIGMMLVLGGCASVQPEPARGSAVELASDKNARAMTTTRASDAAAIDAAAKSAKAAALASAAEADPTPSRIEAAVAARVDSASAQAVADALDKLSTKADQDAKAASEEARKERSEDAAASDLRHWVTLCRWVGLAGVAAGALLGGVLGYFAGPRLGVPVGATIAGTGILVVAFGSTITWLPLVLAGAVIAGSVVWFIAHRRSLSVGDALSKTVDALRGEAKATAGEALSNLDKVMEQSGLRKHFDKARKKWKNPTVDTVDEHG